MPSYTSRLQLKKPAGTETVKVQDLNDNFDRLDLYSQPFVCTATTRPTGTNRFIGLQIFETDTGRLYTWDGTNWNISGADDGLGWTTVAAGGGITVTLPIQAKSMGGVTYLRGRVSRAAGPVAGNTTIAAVGALPAKFLTPSFNYMTLPITAANGTAAQLIVGTGGDLSVLTTISCNDWFITASFATA